MILKLKRKNWDLSILVDGVDVRNVDFSKEFTFINVKKRCIEYRPKVLDDIIELINSLEPEAKAKRYDLIKEDKHTIIVLQTTENLQVKAIDPED